MAALLPALPRALDAPSHAQLKLPATLSRTKLIMDEAQLEGYIMYVHTYLVDFEANVALAGSQFKPASRVVRMPAQVEEASCD